MLQLQQVYVEITTLKMIKICYLVLCHNSSSCIDFVLNVYYLWVDIVHCASSAFFMHNFMLTRCLIYKHVAS